jgi:uncharacterized membrane protein YhhN
MRFFYGYAILLFGDLLSIALGLKTFENSFKPTLLLSLGIYFFHETEKTAHKKQRNRILWGAFFSIVGDIVLIQPAFFVYGLGAFLIAHVCYISAFYLDNDGIIFKKNDRILPTIGILAYGTLFLSIVLPKVGNALLIPVAIYGFTILTMLLMALNRWKNVEKTSFNWVIIGAILFVISDSILAINRFVQPLPFAGILIMSTYGIGQFLIINGVLKHIKNQEKLVN